MNPTIIDTDTHFTEPEDLWTSRMSTKWGDQVMHVRWDDELESEVWVSGDKILSRAWGFLAYGSERANSQNDYPKRKADAHIATWDQAERVKVMDEIGVRVAVLYPNVAGLSPTGFMSIGSPELANEHLRAYNDYQVEWASNFPGRFIPMLVVPFWNIAAATAEIERMADKGFGGIVTTGAPHVHGSPYLSDRAWDPMWSAAEAAGLSVSFHIGNGAPGPLRHPDHEALMAPATHLGYSAIPPMLANGSQVLDLLLSGVLVRHPNLKFVSVESGLGWVPFVLEAADYHFKKALSGPHPWGDVLPSELFHRQVYVNYWFERLEQWHLDAVGVDNILFETDFPHRTCLEAPDVIDAITNRMAHLPEGVREKILWRNAADLYHVQLDV